MAMLRLSWKLIFLVNRVLCLLKNILVVVTVKRLIFILRFSILGRVHFSLVMDAVAYYFTTNYMI